MALSPLVPRRSAAVVVVLVAASIATACQEPRPTGAGSSGAVPTAQASAPLGAVLTTPEPSTAPTPSSSRDGGLLLLAGRPGAMALQWIAGDLRTPIALADPDVAWISTDLAGRVLTTTRSGRAFLSGPLVPGREPTWRRLAIRVGDGATLPGPPSFGTLAPDGSQAAFLAADFASGGPFDVLVVDVPGGSADGTSRALPVARPAEGAPPSWLDDRLVLLTRERGDAAGVTVLDPATGRVADGPGPPSPASTGPPRSGWSGPIAALSIAADGSSLAVAEGFDGPVEIHLARPWLADEPNEPAAVPLCPEPDGGGGLAWLALDETGQRLAIVRTDADGDATEVTVHEAALGWAESRRIALPAGSVRAVVAWLP